MKKLTYKLIVITATLLVLCAVCRRLSYSNFEEGKQPMMIHVNAEEIDQLEVHTGDTIHLESLRQAVVPPYLMLMPFVALPDFLTLKETLSLDEDGVHGAIYVLEVIGEGKEDLTVGFKDIQHCTTTHKKVIPCVAKP